MCPTTVAARHPSFRDETSLVDGGSSTVSPSAALASWLGGRGRSAERDDVRSREGTDGGDSRRGRWVVSATVTGPPRVQSSRTRDNFSFLRALSSAAVETGKNNAREREDRSIEPAAASVTLLQLVSARQLGACVLACLPDLLFLRRSRGVSPEYTHTRTHAHTHTHIHGVRPTMVKAPTMGPSAGTQGIRKIHPGPEIAMNPRNLPTANATTPPSIRTDGKTTSMYHPQVSLFLSFALRFQDSVEERRTTARSRFDSFDSRSCVYIYIYIRVGRVPCVLIRSLF